MFAGTHLDKDDNDEKARDFSDRLSLDPQDFKLPADFGDNDITRDEVKLEMCYLVTSLVRSAFPDVRFITDRALEIFAHLDPTLSARTITTLVATLQDVRETVRYSSISMDFRACLGYGYSLGNAAPAECRIEIVTLPEATFAQVG